MRHPEPTIKNTAVTIAIILLVVMFSSNLFMLQRQANEQDGLARAEAHEEVQEMETLNAGCRATNARFQALIDRFSALAKAERRNDVGEVDVVVDRIVAYEGLAKDLSSIIRRCDEVYPIPTGAS